MKVAGDPSNPMRFKDDATAEELRAEIEHRLNILRKVGILMLQVIEPEVQVASGTRLRPTSDRPSSPN